MKEKMRKNKELKYLRRSELIEIIYLLQKNEQKLTAQVAQLQEQLAVRTLRMADAGSVAEAALAITDIFARAQEAADIYLEEIKRRRDEAVQVEQSTDSTARQPADSQK